MKRSHAALWSLNLGLYEALDGQAPQALSALQAAMKTAEGNAHVSHSLPLLISLPNTHCSGQQWQILHMTVHDKVFADWQSAVCYC